MNTEHLAIYIQQPHLIKMEDLPVLKDLADKNPYASVYSLLYIAGVKQHQSIELDLVIEQQAYRLSDRKRLFHLIQSSFTNQTEEVIPANVSDSIPETAVILELPNEEVIEPLLVNQPEETIVESATIQVETVPEVIENENSEETDSTEEDLFEFETSAFSVGQEYFTEVEEKAEINSEKNSVTEKREETPEIVVEKAVENKVIDTKRSFTSWLKSSDQSATVNSENPSQKPDKQAIIDRFLQEEPSITRAKTDFYSPSKKAKESLDEETIPVSETLAKIYAAQGNFPKAIHVYHQLSLNFPEKKSLFAVQIEELKKKLTL
ncbi:MAG: hypothetical protein IT221_09035 [Fluviicola sp.]|nr:hypothetical protein [Fluviicola sp.]